MNGNIQLLIEITILTLKNFHKHTQTKPCISDFSNIKTYTLLSEPKHSLGHFLYTFYRVSKKTNFNTTNTRIFAPYRFMVFAGGLEV